MIQNKIRFFLSKEARLKAAFQAIHSDMAELDSQQRSLKSNVNEWVLHLDHENRMLKEQLKEIEAKLDRVKGFVERQQVSLLDL